MNELDRQVRRYVAHVLEENGEKISTSVVKQRILEMAEDELNSYTVEDLAISKLIWVLPNEEGDTEDPIWVDARGLDEEGVKQAVEEALRHERNEDS